jgi:hypothetical protein
LTVSQKLQCPYTTCIRISYRKGLCAACKFPTEHHYWDDELCLNICLACVAMHEVVATSPYFLMCDLEYRTEQRVREFMKSNEEDDGS